MADYTNIPGSAACGHWETLLADALDGLLNPQEQNAFNEHKAACPACSALYVAAQKGRQWLEFLSPEPEVPAGLLDRILAQTGPGQVAGYGLVAGGNQLPVHPAAIPAWQRPGFIAQVRRFAEPRLLMTAAMAFFSIALTLNLTGVRLNSLRLSDLRPTAVRSFMERRLTMASTPIIRYYDHLRFVYEVESRMRELRRATQGEGQVSPESDDNGNPQRQNNAQPATPGESRQAPAHKDGGSRVDPPQQSVSPARNDFNELLESSLSVQQQPAHSGGSAVALDERSTRWTA